MLTLALSWWDQDVGREERDEAGEARRAAEAVLTSSCCG